MLAIGNFTDVDGQFRDQIAMLDLSGPTATLSGWYTDFYESTCASVFNTYMRDLDISEDGTYAVVSTTGAYFGGINAGVSCDTISRFPVYLDSPDLEPEWVTYTGGDTTYAVEIARNVVYAGGHMRWVNNPYAGDAAGPGAIPREGIVALDPVNGMPYSWNPGRVRGVGVFDFLVTDEGLWAGSDTERWAGERRERLAFFPYANGTEVPANVVGGLSNDVYLLGRSETTGAVDPSVLYRVNAGGPSLPSADDGPDWESDLSSVSPYRNSGSNAAGWGPVPSSDGSLPSDDLDRAPLALFSTERWDPTGDPEMEWTFPVAVGTPIEVRLYLANRCTCTNDPGERIFSIEVEGVPLATEIDLSGAIGHDVATMLSTEIVSDGSVGILFRHVFENPLVNGIEIVRTDTTGGGINADDDGQRRYFDGSAAPDPTVVFPGVEAWHLARGGFIVNDNVYTGWADGALYRRSFDGSNWGPRLTVPLYGNTFISDLPSITGMFFDPVDERIYYTRSGSNDLFWRHFTPESHSVGATPFTASGDIGSLSPGRVQGMFLSDGAIYFADAVTGDLLRVEFANGTVTGPATTADDTVDWRTRALFAWNGTPAGPGNVAPDASFTFSCVDLSCSFDGSGSSDADGVVVGYDWSFGDGSDATGATVDYDFAAGGSYSVTLTVTDDGGATGVDSRDVTVTPGNVAPDASFTFSCVDLSCSFDGSGSSDADGVVVGYDWSFGDGSDATGATVDYDFAAGGSYSVTLTVTDDGGATGVDSRDVTVTPGNVAPDASFTFSCVDLSCSFDGSGSSDADGVVVGYDWSFGDGSDATGATVDYDFAAGGSYSVTLTVTDDGGATGVDSRDVTVTPGNVAPDASFTFSCVDLSCSFDGSGSSDADGVVVGYDWSFGDGSDATGATVDYDFAAGGSYSVTLTVTDDGGATGVDSRDVTVTPGNVAPDASFTFSCVDLSCSFDGSGSSDADGVVVGYDWSFGDGSDATGATVDYDFAAGGSYSVTLTVTDDGGATGVDSRDVTVTPGNVAPDASFTFSCVDLSCSFDGSGSSDADGVVVGYDWSFGDGSDATGATVDYDFAAGGSYSVTLTVTDDGGATGVDSRDVTVTPGNVAPDASFTFSCVDLSCSFDGSGSSDADGVVVGYDWSFGDGSDATGATVDHDFAAGGSYSVTLTVTDDGGATGVDSRDVTVTPGNVAPDASFTFSCVDLSCSFDGSGSSDADGVVVGYDWSFGDGSDATGATVDHDFAAGGSYSVTLTVTDDGGATGVDSRDVTVNEPGTGDIAFRGAAASNGNNVTSTVTVPGNVASGDTLVLFVTVNGDTTIANVPDGWTQLGAVVSTPTDTWSWVFTRTAPDGFAGSGVSITLADRLKTDMSLLVYSGAAPVTVAIGDEADTASNMHTTPDVPVTVADSWVVAYWADESSDNTGWTLPAGITERTESVGTGGGRITAIAGDTGPLPVGTWAGATATSNTTSSKAPTWSILLTPSGENIPPDASFTFSCVDLSCSFDGSGSSDADGVVVGYDWSFGDGSDATGATVDHDFAAGGSYSVTLTVTDDGGATGVDSRDVTVNEPGTADIAFRGAAASNGNNVTSTVTVPGNVASGDTLVLFVTVNGDTTIANAPDGWTQLGAVVSTPTDTWSWVFTRTAPDGFAGSGVSITLADRLKTDMSLLVYSGAAPVTVAIGDEADTASNMHTTPDVPVTVADSWVVAYWADESSDNTGWTLPAGITERTESVGTGGGRITAIAGDTGPLPVGTWAGATATSNTTSSKAPTWSILLTPG